MTPKKMSKWKMTPPLERSFPCCLRTQQVISSFSDRDHGSLAPLAPTLAWVWSQDQRREVGGGRLSGARTPLSQADNPPSSEQVLLVAFQLWGRLHILPHRLLREAQRHTSQAPCNLRVEDIRDNMHGCVGMCLCVCVCVCVCVWVWHLCSTQEIG